MITVKDFTDERRGCVYCDNKLPFQENVMALEFSMGNHTTPWAVCLPCAQKLHLDITKWLNDNV